MPHYKCEGCKARMHASGAPAELVGNLCPECGALLEPVTELTELVGLRSITPRTGAAVERSEPHQRIADLLEEIAARRAGILEQDRLTAERWLDDSNEPKAAAVAATPSLPVPRSHIP